MSKASWQDTPVYRALLARLKRDMPSGGGLAGFTTTPGGDPIYGAQPAGSMSVGPGGATLITGATAADRGYGYLEQQLRFNGPYTDGEAVARIDMYIEDDQAFEDPRNPNDEYKEAVVGVRVVSEDGHQYSTGAFDTYRQGGITSCELDTMVSDETTEVAAQAVTRSFVAADHADTRTTLNASTVGPSAQVQLYAVADLAESTSTSHLELTAEGVGLVLSGHRETALGIFAGAGQTSPLVLIRDANSQDLVSIQPNGDVVLGSASAGVVLKASDGSQHRIVVAPNGTLSTTVVTS